MNQEAMEFDGSLIVIPVTIGDKKYLLKEASEAACRKFRNAQMSCTKYDSEGNTRTIEGLADGQALLLSMCLFELEIGADGTSVIQEKVVQVSQLAKFSGRVVKKLYTRCFEISELAEVPTLKELKKERVELDKQIEKLEKEEETAKNLETSSESTSE